MSELRKNRNAEKRRAQGDPRRLVTPARVTAAEKTNAIRSLQRAARRCAKCLGRGSAAGLLKLVKAELGGGAK